MTYYAVYEKQELSKQTVSRSVVEVNQKRYVIKLFAQQNKSEKKIKKLADYQYVRDLPSATTLPRNVTFKSATTERR